MHARVAMRSCVVVLFVLWMLRSDCANVCN